jgi:predicted ribosome quality control (RQC) complex YloA/Tae2 family protein
LKDIERSRKISLTAVKRHKNYLSRVLEQIEHNKDIEKKHEEAVLKGNLLLTHKIRIKPHQSKVSLKNIYSDTLDMIEIKMNPKKSVVENANLYFNKYKNINKIKEKWQVKRQTVEAEFSDISNLENQLINSGDINKLNRIKEQLIAMNLLQDANNKSNKQVQNLLKYSFNNLVLENEWELFIGKNGKNNDLLTFTFAHKWDIWLHAQGVPGSHVILRVPKRNTNPPKKIIEKAAQITAYHSKAQHSGVVPVIYTFVKFVHRIRKADPGTVSVQGEKVIFVEPLNIQH